VELDPGNNASIHTTNLEQAANTTFLSRTMKAAECTEFNKEALCTSLI
jgi:hypothetical protein